MIDFLRRHRTLRDDLLGTFQRGDIGIGGEVLRRAARDQHQADDDGDRQQDVDDAAGQIDPEVAERLRRTSGKAADQHDGQHDAGRRRDEVVHRQRHHLREVAHRRLGHVGLPVGVGHEADRRVEREVWRHRVLAGRIQRQHILQALDRIHQNEAGEAERQHRDGVGHPVLLVVLADAADLVDADLERTHDGAQERALAVEHARHVAAERLGDQDYQNAVHRDL